MFEVEPFARQVLDNCDISDAQHAGLYSTCGLALRLRDLYKWEHGLNPWEEREPSEILDWIGEKETLWEKLAEAKYRHLSIQGRRYDPFDTIGINVVLNSRGLFYGAGYAFSLKPTFFLAEIENKAQCNGYTVYTLGRELARDLLTLPALAQDRLILLRTDSARLFLWDQMAYLKKSCRPALQFALEQCGLNSHHQQPEVWRQHLPEILAVQKDNYIYHEIGELSDSTFHSNIWRELIAAFPHSPVELLARGLKDLLADTHQNGTLPHLISKRKAAALGLYAAFLDGMPRQLFPELREAFNSFTKTCNWHIIKEAAVEGYRHARSYAAEIVSIFQKAQKKQQLQQAKDHIEKKLLAEIKRKETPGS